MRQADISVCHTGEVNSTVTILGNSIGVSIYGKCTKDNKVFASFDMPVDNAKTLLRKLKEAVDEIEAINLRNKS